MLALQQGLTWALVLSHDIWGKADWVALCTVWPHSKTTLIPRVFQWLLFGTPATFYPEVFLSNVASLAL